MKKILLGILVLMTTIVSCTDKEEDIDLEYQAEVGITAAHIFDDYEQFQIGDFDMSIDGWKLNLSVRVYDKSGELVDKTEKLCNSLSESLNYAPYLAPGEYTVVSIADFREGLGGTGYKFWNIENESNIQDLSITENDSYYPVVFETLGIDVQKIEITNSSKSIIADIKPVTSLVHVYMSDKDYSGWGLDGYSRFVALSDGYFIKALKAKDNVRFKNGKCTFNYSEQYSNYNLAISEVHSKWEEKKAPTSYIYRALLPEENKGFSFHIQKRELPQEYYDTFITYCGEFDTEGESEILPEIASNKQYVVNMIFDAMKLDVMEYPADYNHERYTEQFVKDYNKQLMANMVNTKYENILVQDENYANGFLDMEPSSYNNSGNYYTAHYPRSRANHFETYVTSVYLNSDYTACRQVQLLLPDLSEDMFVHLKELLSNRFVAEEEGKYGSNRFTYLEPGKPEDDSKYRVVLERTYNEEFGKYIYFINYVLRDKFLPQEEGLWADFTTLFGADKNTVKSTMESLGHSYITSDNSYSDYGSDYYNINNNDYANMVGFVFNSDYQVSQFWVYYISTKVNDVYDYLTQKYTAAESENTNYVKVFYNDKKDIKVVLDLINGAVVYTKLDMKQHKEWTSLGYGVYVEDLVTGFFNVENKTYSVEIQQHTTNPGRYRLVNPYGEAYPYNYPGDYDTSKDYYMEIDATDPDGVVMPMFYSGMNWGYGEFAFISLASYYIDIQGNPFEAVKAAGYCGTFKNGVITFPAESIIGGMTEYNDFGLYLTNRSGKFAVYMPGVYESMASAKSVTSKRDKLISKRELLKNIIPVK